METSRCLLNRQASHIHCAGQVWFYPFVSPNCLEISKGLSPELVVGCLPLHHLSALCFCCLLLSSKKVHLAVAHFHSTSNICMDYWTFSHNIHLYTCRVVCKILCHTLFVRTQCLLTKTWGPRVLWSYLNQLYTLYIYKWPLLMFILTNIRIRIFHSHDTTNTMGYCKK